jgi:hypothetical protein
MIKLAKLKPFLIITYVKQTSKYFVYKNVVHKYSEWYKVYWYPTNNNLIYFKTMKVVILYVSVLPWNVIIIDMSNII